MQQNKVDLEHGHILIQIPFHILNRTQNSKQIIKYIQKHSEKKEVENPTQNQLDNNYR